MKGGSSGYCGSGYKDMNHCLIVVGYHLADADDDEDVSYWILKNQWGTDWGNEGVAYLEFGYNTCGLANDVTLPKLGGGGDF